MHARIVTPVLATTGSVVAGERIHGAGEKFGAKHVDLIHVAISARRVVTFRPGQKLKARVEQVDTLERFDDA